MDSFAINYDVGHWYEWEVFISFFVFRFCCCRCCCYYCYFGCSTIKWKCLISFSFSSLCVSLDISFLINYGFSSNVSSLSWNIQHNVFSRRWCVFSFRLSFGSVDQRKGPWTLHVALDDWFITLAQTRVLLLFTFCPLLSCHRRKRIDYGKLFILLLMSTYLDVNFHLKCFRNFCDFVSYCCWLCKRRCTAARGQVE